MGSGRHQGLGSYSKRFIGLLARDKPMALLLLQFNAMRQPERDTFCTIMHSIGCTDVFIGRMETLKSSMKKAKWWLPPEANHVESLIMMNSAFLFGPPCASWWTKAMKVLRRLDTFKNGNLSISRFFIGHQEFCLDYLDVLTDEDCPGHPWKQAEVPLATSLLRAGNDCTAPHMVPTDRRLSTELLSAFSQFGSGLIKCIHFDSVRSISVLISEGQLSHVLETMDVVLRERFTEIVNQIFGMGNQEILQRITDIWEQEKASFQLCQRFLSLIDTKRPGAIMRLVYGSWVRDVIHSKLKLPGLILDLIHEERAGLFVHTIALQNMTQMLRGLGGSVYDDVFETPFLEDTNLYYQRASEDLSKAFNRYDHKKELYAVLSAEVHRASPYVTEHTTAKLLAIFGDIILEEKALWISSKLMEKSSEADRVRSVDPTLVDLAMICAFLDTTEDGYQMLSCSMRRRFDYCLSLMLKGEDTFNDVSAIITFWGNSMRLIRGAMNSRLVEQLKGSLDGILNSSKSYAEALSLFADARLREAATESLMHGHLESLLDIVIDLVSIFKDKDVFELYHRKHLLKRVSFGTINAVWEEGFLSKLDGLGIDVYRARCFLRDIKESAEFMKSFQQHDVAVSLNAIRNFAFPNKSVICIPPDEVSPTCEQIKAEFLVPRENAPSRLLTFQALEGYAILKANLDAGRTYEFKVSTCDMCVLMMFNSSDYLSYDDIKEGTGLPELYLERSLRALLECKILNYFLWYFCVNEDFAPTSTWVSACDEVAKKEREEERAATDQTIKVNRDPQIEAAIARIMKEYKRMSHTNLISEVLMKLENWFKPDIADIKRCMERLISDGYLDRNEDNYRYIE